MKTITLHIGNSDDRLSQKEWAGFVRVVCLEVSHFAAQVHFSGLSSGDKEWQKACWVFEVDASKVTEMKGWLAAHRKRYGQDSVAWTEGETVFI